MAIELGYFTMPVHPPERDYVQTLKEDREAILLADRLGFTEAYVGEHVTDVAESITDCTVFLASLAHVTKQIKLGTGTVNLPNGHPAAIATKVAMLDNILEGRFLFGISPGGLPSDWEMFGNLDADRREKFAECIDLILGIWEGDAPYNLEREALDDLDRADADPRDRSGPDGQALPEAAPADRRHGRRALLGERGERRRPRLGRHLRQLPPAAVGQVPLGEGRRGMRGGRSHARPGEMARRQDRLRRRRRAHRARVRLRARQPVPLLLRAARLQARSRRPRQPLQGRSRDLPDSAVTTDYIVDQLVVAGTAGPGRRRAARPSATTIGDFGTLLYCGIDWVDPRLARRSMELMADEVMPRVNRAIAPLAEAARADG